MPEILLKQSILIVAASYTDKCSGFTLLGSKLNIFTLWTQQDILGRHLGLWETPIPIYWVAPTWQFLLAACFSFTIYVDIIASFVEGFCLY